MVFVKATEDKEEDAPAMAEAFAAMDRFTEEMVASGVFVAAAGLKNQPRPSALPSTASAARWSTGHSPRPVSWSPAFDLGGRGHRRGRGLGETLPQSHAGPERDRNPAVLRGGGSGRVSHARRSLDASRGRARDARRRLRPSAAAGRLALRRWPTRRYDCRQDAPGDRSDLSHWTGQAQSGSCRSGPDQFRSIVQRPPKV